MAEHLLPSCPKWAVERHLHFGDSIDIKDVFHDYVNLVEFPISSGHLTPHIGTAWWARHNNRFVTPEVRWDCHRGTPKQLQVVLLTCGCEMRRRSGETAGLTWGPACRTEFSNIRQLHVHSHGLAGMLSPAFYDNIEQYQDSQWSKHNRDATSEWVELYVPLDVYFIGMIACYINCFVLWYQVTVCMISAWYQFLHVMQPEMSVYNSELVLLSDVVDWYKTVYFHFRFFSV